MAYCVAPLGGKDRWAPFGDVCKDQPLDEGIAISATSINCRPRRLNFSRKSMGRCTKNNDVLQKNSDTKIPTWRTGLPED